MANVPDPKLSVDEQLKLLELEERQEAKARREMIRERQLRETKQRALAAAEADARQRASWANCTHEKRGLGTLLQGQRVSDGTTRLVCTHCGYETSVEELRKGVFVGIGTAQQALSMVAANAQNYGG